MTGTFREAAYTAVLLILAVNSFSDVRRHEIVLIFTIICGGLGLLCSFALPGTSPGPLPASLLPGGFFLLFSFLTREAVGAGDGVLLLALAGYLSLTDILVIVAFGTLLSSGYAAVKLIRGEKGSCSFAFVPFLLAGYVLYLAVQG